MTAAEYIENMFPDMYADTDLMEFYVELAGDMSDTSYFGTLLNYAIALRAMHMYVLDKDRPRGGAGFITGKSEGNASIRYSEGSGMRSSSDLILTHWGQRLRSLIKARGGSVSVSSDPLNAL